MVWVVQYSVFADGPDWWKRPVYHMHVDGETMIDAVRHAQDRLTVVHGRGGYVIKNVEEEVSEADDK